MVKNNALRYSLLLVIILGLLVVSGRMLFPKKDVKKDSLPTPTTVTPAVKPKIQQITASDDTLTECAQKLKQSATLEGTAYDTNSILASFTQETTFTEAIATIANYGLKPYRPVDAEKSYPSRHIITIGIQPGEEFIKICQLKANPLVKNAILNYLFELHE